MPDLVVLDDRRDPVPLVVETLEDALEQARAGRLVGVAILGALRTGGTSTAFVLGEGTRAQLHFAGATLSARLLAEGM